MSETERYIPFWREFLFYLLFTLFILTLVIYALTEELLIFILTFTFAAALVVVVIWITHKEHKSRLGKRGILGYLLIFFSNFMFQWIWVAVCIALLGSAIMLYDVASKRNLSDAELEE